jgi:hypothetical protein
MILGIGSAVVSASIPTISAITAKNMAIFAAKGAMMRSSAALWQSVLVM